MIRRLLLLFFMVPMALSSANALTRVEEISYSQPLQYEAALIRQEGGCVFIIEEGYPLSRLEFADLNDVERKAVSNPLKAATNLESHLYEFFNKIQFSASGEAASGKSVQWENPRHLIDENFGYIFIPAVAAQLKKAGPGRKIQFYIGEESAVTVGSIFAGDHAIHLTVEKINGKAVPLWKLVINAPARFYKESTGKKETAPFRTWVYYQIDPN